MRAFLAAMALWAFAMPALAVEPDEILKDPTLEARARALSGGLRCLVCQNQTIDDSDAPLAKDLRILIRERLVKGDSDAEAREFVVSRYGQFVLLKPRLGPRTLLLWVGPFAILVLAGVAAFMLRRTNAEAERDLTAQERSALETALSDPR